MPFFEIANGTLVLWYSMVTLSVQSGLRFNYVEFGTIKIRIH